MTYRERRLRRAERLRGWAEKRETQANAQFASNPELRSDHAFNTQPGHIPARARMNNADTRAFQSLDKAAQMERRADAIEAAAERAIYSDDPDAPDRLREKIAALEAERDRAKTINAAIRKVAKAHPGGGAEANAGTLRDMVALGYINDKEAASLARSYAIQPYHGLGFPAYHLTNLGANIRRQKQRLAEIERQKTEGPPWRYYPGAKYEGVCMACDKPIDKGAPIVYRRGTDEVKHAACHSAAFAPTPGA